MSIKGKQLKKTVIKVKQLTKWLYDDKPGGSGVSSRDVTLSLPAAFEQEVKE